MFYEPLDSNALASSIVLVCRPRSEDVKSTTRLEFIRALRRELPEALRLLQKGNIAPVDLAQAAIGPGMAIFSRHRAVLEADGTPMRVRSSYNLDAVDQHTLAAALLSSADRATRATGEAMCRGLEQAGAGAAPLGSSAD